MEYVGGEGSGEERINMYIILYSLYNMFMVCTLVCFSEHPVQFLYLIWGEELIHLFGAEEVMVCKFESGDDSLPTLAKQPHSWIERKPTSLINNPSELPPSSGNKNVPLYFPPSTIHCNLSPFSIPCPTANVSTLAFPPFLLTLSSSACKMTYTPLPR